MTIGRIIKALFIAYLLGVLFWAGAYFAYIIAVENANSNFTIPSFGGYIWIGQSIVSLFLLFIIAGFCYLSFFRVDENKLATIKWRFIFSPKIREGHNIAVGCQQGNWARVYGPGWRFIPFIKWFGEVVQKEMLVIPADKFGLVEAKDGEPLPPGQIMTQRAIECGDFSDGEGFLMRGGEKGFQLRLLPPGRHPINYMVSDEDSGLFKVHMVDPVKIAPVTKDKPGMPGETIECPQFGYVVSEIGQEVPEEEGRLIADKLKPTEISGIRYERHNNFQDLVAALAMGLERGVQQEILEQGSYTNNPSAIKIKIVPATFINEGHIGILISNVGSQPSEDDYIKKNGVIIPVLIPGINRKDGTLKRGVLSETLGTGFSNIHPVMFGVIEHDITPRRICWDKSPNNELSFNPISLVTKEGFRPKFEAEVGIQITKENAPAFIALNKNFNGFVKDTIHPQLNDIIMGKASQWPIEKLFKEREQIRKEIEDELKKVTEGRFIEILYFRISDIDFSGDKELERYVHTLTRRINARREIKTIQQETRTEEKRVELEKQRAMAANQVIIAKADLERAAAVLMGEAIITRGKAYKDLADKLGSENPLVKAMAFLMADPNSLPNIFGSMSKTTQ